jgi:hypothetical protein
MDEMKQPASAQIAGERNNNRLRLANKGDQSTMSKHLPLSLTPLLPDPVVGPNDSFLPKPSLMDAIQTVAKTPAPLIQFSMNPEALKNNAQLFHGHHYSMEALISQNNAT